MIFLSLFLISLHKCVKHNHVLLVTHPETYTLCHWGNVFSSQKSYFHIFTSHSLPLFFGIFLFLFCFVVVNGTCRTHCRVHLILSTTVIKHIHDKHVLSMSSVMRTQPLLTKNWSQKKARSSSCSLPSTGTACPSRQSPNHRPRATTF